MEVLVSRRLTMHAAWRLFSVGGLMTLILVSCREPNSSPVPSLDSGGHRVADAFAENAVAGDWMAASRYLIPNVSVENLRGLGEDSLEYDLRIVGESTVRDGAFTYSLRGRDSVPEEFGGGIGRVKAVLQVWVTSTAQPSRWRVYDWRFQVIEIDYPPHQSGATSTALRQ